MLAKLRDAIQDKLAAEPIECPRGWGKVVFPLSGGALWPFVWLGRTCPISGAESCAACGYASNPDALKLSENLAALDDLRRTGTLSEDEYGARRGALLTLHPQADPAAGFRITAWVLGPLGVLFTGAGVPLARRVDAGFWVLAGAGAVLLVLTISFAALARKPAPDPLSRRP